MLQAAPTAPLLLDVSLLHAVYTGHFVRHGWDDPFLPWPSSLPPITSEENRTY